MVSCESDVDEAGTDSSSEGESRDPEGSLIGRADARGLADFLRRRLPDTIEQLYTQYHSAECNFLDCIEPLSESTNVEVASSSVNQHPPMTQSEQQQSQGQYIFLRNEYIAGN
jgi:hypothetical protein